MVATITVGKVIVQLSNQASSEYIVNLFAVYFDEPEDDSEGLMILGHITSDMLVFDDMTGSVEMQIDLAQ